MKNVRKILLTAAYALLLIAVIAMAAALGVQIAGNAKMEARIESLEAAQRELSEENAALMDEREDLLNDAETRAQEIAALEQRVRSIQEQNASLRAELDEALRYTLDVRDKDAGDIVSAEEIDGENLAQYFTASKIVEGDKVYQRIIGKSYVENDDIGLDELRYMKLIHYNFDHKVQIGELIVHEELVEDYQEIFRELFEAGYEINSMHLIDNYWTGDGLSSDSASIEVNNTSAFCYRRVAGGKGLSNHALGRAIDINPQQNPYVTFDSKGRPQWTHDNADDYIDRDTGLPHVITHDDLCYKLFKEHGFDWGGDWKTLKDYQHFDKED